MKSTLYRITCGEIAYVSLTWKHRIDHSSQLQTVFLLNTLFIFYRIQRWVTLKDKRYLDTYDFVKIKKLNV